MGLQRGDVVAAAMELADHGGIGAVTMRAVGGQLGVEAMSLYHHVAGKEDLLDAMVDAVFAEMERPSTTGDWRTEMQKRSRSVRTVLRRHPWALPLLDSRTSPGPATFGHHDAVIGCLRANGFSVRAAAHAIALLDSFVYGFALQESTLPFESGEGASELASSLVEQMGEAFPHLAEMATEHVMQPGYDFAEEFDFGLDLILDALASLVEGS